MNSNELKYWLAFNQIPEVGAVKYIKLVNYFKDLKTAWNCSFNDLLKAGIDQKAANNIILFRNKVNPEQELEKVVKSGIKIVTIKDKNYPKALAQIYNPPSLFYFKGNINILNQPCFSVVGTRKITTYGKRATADIVSKLANNGLTIISGLAFGVDALAHQTTIDSCGKTAAILGSGLNNIYPIANCRLAQEIIEHDGCLISEYPVNMMALKHHFPIRNRIIAGLSLGTLIVEAGQRSGASITAKLALEQNRLVFAVPGSIYSQASFGSNKLIKMGAIPVTSADDILEALSIEKVFMHQKVKEIIADSKEEKTIMDILSTEPISIDKIVLKSKLDIQIINSTLTMMEMKGIVKNLGGQNYILNQ